MTIAAKVASLAMLCTSCGAATSAYMTRASTLPSGPRAGKAVVLFAADIEVDLGPSDVITIYDENKRFLGDLFEHSMFEVELSPGKHGFAAIDLRGTSGGKPFSCGDAFTADLEAGKVYLAWLRYGEPEHRPDDAIVLPRRWVFARPDARLLRPRDVLRVWKSERALPELKPFYEPDAARGQTLIDRHGADLCVPPVEPGPHGVDLPANYGFDRVPD